MHYFFRKNKRGRRRGLIIDRNELFLFIFSSYCIHYCENLLLSKL
jgi:hypothetical protein